MKYIRTYGDYNSWKLDYSNPDRGFRLAPTLYRYPHGKDNILLENDDPRKHGDSTYMEIYLDSDTEFSFYIGNAPGGTQTIRDCKVNWGDGNGGSTRLTADDKGFKLSHNYKAGSYSIELYAIEDYSIIGDTTNFRSLISHPNSIKRVILGSGVVSIGEQAFSECSSITSVHIPNSVISIGESAFDGCSSLTSVYIPESVTSIGGAFYNCTSLTSVYIPESVTSIGGAFYNCTSLTSIYIPEGVTTIEDGVFADCTSLTSVYIPKSTTTIEDGVFKNCTSLTSIYIPEGVTSIGSTTYEGVFEGCSSLTSIYIPRSVTSIGRNAFKGCSSLTSIDIPESVTSIGENAFDDCLLTHISSLNTTAPTIGNDVFANIPTNGTLHIKPGATGYDAWLSKLPSGWRIVEDL